MKNKRGGNPNQKTNNMKVYTAKIHGTTGAKSADSYESTRKIDVKKWAKRIVRETGKTVVISVWNGSDEIKLESL